MKPLFRWTGSKNSVMNQLLEHFPTELSGKIYYEPCFGSGAVGLELMTRGVLRDSMLVISDIAIVVKLWTALRDLPLTEIQADVDRAARLYREELRAEATTNPFAALQLTRLSFRGLWRTNRRGEHNVPEDPYRAPYAGAEVAKWTSDFRKLLKRSGCMFAIVSGGWEACVSDHGHVSKFVYFDPPYLGTFDQYSETPFNPQLPKALRRLNDVVEQGTRVFISNSPEAAALLPQYERVDLFRTNSITVTPGTKAKVKECLFMSKETK